MNQIEMENASKQGQLMHVIKLFIIENDQNIIFLVIIHIKINFIIIIQINKSYNYYTKKHHHKKNYSFLSNQIYSSLKHHILHQKNVFLARLVYGHCHHQTKHFFFLFILKTHSILNIYSKNNSWWTLLCIKYTTNRS